MRKQCGPCWVHIEDMYLRRNQIYPLYTCGHVKGCAYNFLLLSNIFLPINIMVKWRRNFFYWKNLILNKFIITYHSTLLSLAFLKERNGDYIMSLSVCPSARPSVHRSQHCRHSVPLGRFDPSQVLWNRHGPYMCNNMVIVQLGPFRNSRRATKWVL